MPTHNGIPLGPQSPLLTPGGARRLLARTEEDDQRALMELLVGPVRKGQPRDPQGGMIPKHPELYLLTHIPNAGAGGSRGMAGRMKALGVMADYPDLHLPVTRGPFLTLYVELKREGARGRASQHRLHDRLRAEGHCVLQGSGVAWGAAVILGYLALPRNRLSGRPVPRHLFDLPTIDHRLDRWRQECYEMLIPRIP